MKNHPDKESRTKCEKDIIFFNNLGFGVDSNKFQKLRTTEEINNRCVEHCEDLKCTTRVKILNIMSAHENNQIKKEGLSLK